MHELGKHYVVEVPVSPHDRIVLKNTSRGIIGYPYPKDYALDFTEPSFAIKGFTIERQFSYWWEYARLYEPIEEKYRKATPSTNALYTVQLSDDLWLGYRGIDKTWHHVDSTFRTHYQTIFNEDEIKNIAPKYRAHIKPLDELLG